MRTSVVVGFVLAALGACAPQEGTPTGGSEGSSSSSGAETTLDDPSNGPGPIQTVTSETDADPTTSSTGPGEPTTTGEPSTGEDCQADVLAVADQLAGARCSVVLGFDSAGALTGWHSVCGEVPGGDPITEKDALGATKCCSEGGVFLNVPDMEGMIASPFVVHLAPVDPTDGGVAIISNHLGGVAFEGSIGSAGPGTISIPDAWKPAADLADAGECTGAGFAQSFTSYHAGDGNNEPDIEATVSAAIDASLLPDAMMQAGATVDRGVLLGYEDSAGAPTRYIVLLELSGA